jgi:hypothetical protein
VKGEDKKEEKTGVNFKAEDTNSILRSLNIKLFLINTFLDLFKSWQQLLVAVWLVFIILILEIRGFSFLALFWTILLPGIFLGLLIDKKVHEQPIFDLLWDELFPLILFVWSIVIFILPNIKAISVDFLKLLYRFSPAGILFFLVLKYSKERFSRVLLFYKEVLTKKRLKVIEGFLIGYILTIWIYGLLYTTIFYITNGLAFQFITDEPPKLFDFLYFSFVASLSPAYGGYLVPSIITTKILCFSETIVFLIIVGLFFSNIISVRDD